FLHVFRVGDALINRSYDLQLVARGDVPAAEAVLVYLDEKSHTVLQQPLNAPWDRTLHARLIDRLTAAGTKAIVFDIVFSDPDSRDPAVDSRLAESMKASKRVVLAVDVVRTGPHAKSGTPPIPAFRDVAAALGSDEVIPDPDLVVR